MKIDQATIDGVVTHIVDLCRIPSPTGFTAKAVQYLQAELEKMGYEPIRTRKGSVLVCLGGTGRGLAFAAHVDTLGAMVRTLKPNGRLRLTKLGGYPENAIEGENCIVFTRDGREFTGTIQCTQATPHVYHEPGKLERNDANMEVVLDEKVRSKEDLERLGVRPGDFIAFDPRTVVTPSGFIKSRHLDDKAGSGILLALARWVKCSGVTLNRKVYLIFTVYEEVGHGGAAGIPEDVEEMISVDMGAIGDDLQTDEYKVSICVKDSRGPYDYDVTTGLVRIAAAAELNYATDIYPHYGSDVEAALAAGYDIRHGLVGPGVYASHGYERTHREALENTLGLLAQYITEKR